MHLMRVIVTVVMGIVGGTMLLTGALNLWLRRDQFDEGERMLFETLCFGGGAVLLLAILSLWRL